MGQWTDICKCVFQVQALRSVEKYLQLEKLYVLGTNCVDNGPREGLGKFLQAASSSPDTVLHYEFMQVCHCPVLTTCLVSGAHVAVMQTLIHIEMKPTGAHQLISVLVLAG